MLTYQRQLFARIIQSICLKNSAEFTGKHLCWSLSVFNTVAGLQSATFFKKGFRLNFANFSRTPFRKTPPRNCLCNTCTCAQQYLNYHFQIFFPDAPRFTTFLLLQIMLKGERGSKQFWKTFNVIVVIEL